MHQIEKLPLAAVHYRRGFDIDAVLRSACAHLRIHGVGVGGFVQSSSHDRSQCSSSVHLVDLRSGKTFNIWDARGNCARGCRLDERGLVDTEPNLLAAIADRVDLLVINRFGRAESLGRGLLGVFTAAIETDIPVLTAVRHPYEQAWDRFHGGWAQALAASADAIVAWYCAAASRHSPAPATP